MIPVKADRYNCFILDRKLEGTFADVIKAVLAIPALPQLPFKQLADPLEPLDPLYLEAIVQASIMFHATINQDSVKKQSVLRTDSSFNATLLDIVVSWSCVRNTADPKVGTWHISVSHGVEWAKCQEFADWAKDADWQISAEFDWTQEN